MSLIAQQDYSERKLKHHNYSSLYRGVCVTRSCTISREETLLDRHKALEGCLNNTFWKMYKLKTRLTTSPTCYPTDNNNLAIDKWDTLVALMCILIITLNLVATVYDLRYPKKLKSKGMTQFSFYVFLYSCFLCHYYFFLFKYIFRTFHPMSKFCPLVHLLVSNACYIFGNL